MVATRIIALHTKLATTRWWHTTTLAEEFGVVDADEDDLYAAMDWLLARQDTLRKKRAARHLSEGALVLYESSACVSEKAGFAGKQRWVEKDGFVAARRALGDGGRSKFLFLSTRSQV